MDNRKVRLKNFIDIMERSGVTICLIPTQDYHGSEYVGDYFKCREYLSGFTGSAGTLLIAAAAGDRTECFCGLWTDGRYFIQAEKQLSGSGITLFKTGEPRVPSLEACLENLITPEDVLAFDGRVVSAENAVKFEEAVKAKNAGLRVDLDLVHELWRDAPPLSFTCVYLLDEKETGESRSSKLSRLRAAMREQECKTHILTSLDDIAWLCSLRAFDVACSPVFLSYAIITEQAVLLFAGKTTREGSPVFSDSIKAELAADGIVLKAYEDFYAELKHLSGSILLSPPAVNALTYKLLKARQEVNLVEADNPTRLFKAIKTPEEISCMRNAHVKDGVALTKFIYWIKNHPDISSLTELDVVKRLEEFRKEQEGYLEPSFETIAGYGANGAIVHYHVNEESNADLGNGFLLVDSGGQYTDGTTDVTRTIYLNSDGKGPDDAQKEHYTCVLMGMLRVMSARFLAGECGDSLDTIARAELNKRGLDFNHGTGHGVGYRLNVHEGPNAIRKPREDGSASGCPLKPGMITSDEPGVYLEGKYGIRIENLILCIDDGGGYLAFRPLTMAPVEVDAINIELMSLKDRRYLSDYHHMVLKTIGMYLTHDEQKWLEDIVKRTNVSYNKEY